MSQTCQESAGFLFKHACSGDALQQCGDCEKWLCEKHAQEIEGGHLCVACARAELEQSRSGDSPRGSGAGRGRLRERRPEDDPFFYGSMHYDGYGSYRRGHWGHEHYASTRDSSDFTEADGESFANEGDEGWEQDMGAS